MNDKDEVPTGRYIKNNKDEVPTRRYIKNVRTKPQELNKYAG